MKQELGQTWLGLFSDSLLPEVNPHEGGSGVSMAGLGVAGCLVHHHLQLLIPLCQGCLQHTHTHGHCWLCPC